MPRSFSFCLIFTAISFCLTPAPVSSQIPKLELGPLDVGGAIRFNYFYKDWEDDPKIGDFDLDTVRINLDLEWKQLIGSAEYRYYRYERIDRDTHFLHHGWLGWRFSEQNEVHLGVHQAPFGILPYASHNWFFQLPYYVGLEDDYDLGVKWIHKNGPWNLQFAYYNQDEGDYVGDSHDSARYSYDPVIEDGAANEERHQFNLRAAYTFHPEETVTHELGLSLQGGLIPNRKTNRDGNHKAVALHLNSTWDRWNWMNQLIYYEYDLENPGGISDSYVTMGAYDYAYNAAAEAAIFTTGLSYTLPVSHPWIDSITFYDDFSYMYKLESGFEDTIQNVLGAAVASGNWYIYIDLAQGENHPWIGPVWTNALGSGGDGDWHTRFNINIGFYF